MFSQKYIPPQSAVMRYKDYTPNDPECVHAVFSNRAYAAVIDEVLRNGYNETGGIFIGNIWRRVWYIVDCIDPGQSTINEPAFFTWDSNYVNHLLGCTGSLYKYPLSLLGFWHRHPGSMDTFSGTDIGTICANLRDCPHGLLSMLVNIDPELRMTFYYCYGDSMMKIHYDHGDEYFPRELLEYASPEDLIQRQRKVGFRVKPYKSLDASKMPKSIHSSSKKQSEPQPEPQNQPQPQTQTQPEPQPSSCLTVVSPPPRVLTAADAGDPRVNKKLAEYLVSKMETELESLSNIHADGIRSKRDDAVGTVALLLSSAALTTQRRTDPAPQKTGGIPKAAAKASEAKAEFDAESEKAVSPKEETADSEILDINMMKAMRNGGKY